MWVRSVHASGLSLGKVGIGSVLTSVLQLCYKHQVMTDSSSSLLLLSHNKSFYNVCVYLGQVGGSLQLSDCRVRSDGGDWKAA